MRHALLLPVLASVACETGRLAWEPATAADCDSFAQTASDLQYCVDQVVARAPTLDRAAAVCAGGRAAEGPCRRAWAVQHATDSQVPVDALLDLCGEAEACVRAVLDARPHEDVRVQLGRCGELGGDQGRACAGRALQQWRRSGPDAGAVAGLASAGDEFAETVGWWVGVVVACDRVGACPASGEVAGPCTEAVGRLRASPSLCPAPAAGT
jgi:hypothetical protein